MKVLECMDFAEMPMMETTKVEEEDYVPSKSNDPAQPKGNQTVQNNSNMHASHQPQPNQPQPYASNVQSVQPNQPNQPYASNVQPVQPNQQPPNMPGYNQNSQAYLVLINQV